MEGEILVAEEAYNEITRQPMTKVPTGPGRLRFRPAAPECTQMIPCLKKYSNSFHTFVTYFFERRLDGFKALPETKT